MLPTVGVFAVIFIAAYIHYYSDFRKRSKTHGGVVLLQRRGHVVAVQYEITSMNGPFMFHGYDCIETERANCL